MTNENLDQQHFYDQLIQQEKPVNVFLVNGVKLYGKIQSQDPFTIILTSNKQDVPQLVYKHAISTVQSLTDQV